MPFPVSPDLIFVSLENWDNIWRRNQFVCAELARRYPDKRILFVGLPRNVSNDLSHGRIGVLFQRGVATVEGFANITVIQPLKLLPDSWSLGRWVNERLFRRHVKAAARRLEFNRPLLWINAHHAAHLVGCLDESAVLYDITDDWTALTQSTVLKQRIIHQDAKLCADADAVIVCSQRLQQMKRNIAGSVHLIPNGVEIDHYASVADANGSVPEAAAAWAKPVFGYTGTVHPDRVDVNLVEELSRLMHEEGNGSLVFVGPNHLSADQIKRLSARGNLHFLGPVPYQQIPEYMRAFNVCIVPHCMSAFTESLNPIKLWEYLAAGKPIVATDVAGFRDYPGQVNIARNADEFLIRMREALKEGSDKAVDRRAVAKQNSWSTRVDEIERVLMQLHDKPALIA